LVMMEFMACGRPVVASYLTGHRDVLDKDYSLLVHSKKDFDISCDGRIVGRWEDPDLDEIIAQLDWAYQNRDAIPKMGERAAKAMSRLTWKETAQEFCEIVKNGEPGTQGMRYESKSMRIK